MNKTKPSSVWLEFIDNLSVRQAREAECAIFPYDFIFSDAVDPVETREYFKSRFNQIAQG